MTSQQCHEHGEEPFFVYKGMLPTVVPPTAELECEDGDIPYQSNSGLFSLRYAQTECNSSLIIESPQKCLNFQLERSTPIAFSMRCF